MKSKCFHCGVEVDIGSKNALPYISLVWNHRNHRVRARPGIGELFFHVHCFREISGDEYSDALESSVYGFSKEQASGWRWDGSDYVMDLTAPLKRTRMVDDEGRYSYGIIDNSTKPIPGDF